MIRNTLSTDQARGYYDFWGVRYDWFTFFEAKAKSRSLELLDLAPGQVVLNVGMGTGKDQFLIHEKISPDGFCIGVDISREMLKAAYQRSENHLCEADGRVLPFVADSMDRLYAAYVLDLISLADLPGILASFRRVIKPAGKVVLLSLTEGVDLASRTFVSMWKALYAVSPITCGGCRPLLLSKLTQQSGLKVVHREIVVQMGIPSEICVATRST